MVDGCIPLKPCFWVHLLWAYSEPGTVRPQPLGIPALGIGSGSEQGPSLSIRVSPEISWTPSTPQSWPGEGNTHDTGNPAVILPLWAEVTLESALARTSFCSSVPTLPAPGWPNSP